MVIKGYTDDAGSDIYNKKLSAFRANIVKSYIIGQGVNPTRITAVGIGEEKPLKPNTTREGRRQNRRVEVELVAEQAN
jgi:outer membrane protein OmpA-like peptidoglycan-associated protein